MHLKKLNKQRRMRMDASTKGKQTKEDENR
jgi:hypothetical protein